MVSEKIADRTPPVGKNNEYIVNVTGLNHDGEGVGRVDGFTLFIQGALLGEKVRIKVLKVKKQYGYAKLLEVLEPSPDRTEAACPIYKQCGGCQVQHLSYDAQLAWKHRMVVDNLERIGKLKVRMDGAGSGSAIGLGETDEGVDGVSEGLSSGISGGRSYEMTGPEVIVHPTLGMDQPWRYRNKAQVPMGESEAGLVGGFYAKGSHRIVDMDVCLIQHDRNDEVVRRVKQISREIDISAYNEETRQGLLRHVVVKFGFRTGEVMVVLVTNGERIPKAEILIRRIREEIEGVRSICQNINRQHTNVIFGEETRVLWGQDVIYDMIGDVRFAISARSFYQVNPVQTKVLYDKAVEYAGLTGSETVIDAYCGIGTISLFLARHAGKVYGVEVVPEAIEDARRNAELNGIANVEFAAGKAEEVIPRWKELGIDPDIIVVDPPRKGCDPLLLDTILAMSPKRVVYVSCNPSTLARDLRILEDGGYRTVEVQPVDMFPHTVHVECVIGIQRIDT
ncbi:23S rRNA (uracil(1939)-C(5))-methyltransferase RlmD [Ferviditalea candida]|uniref:23S rRNA (Uracil(1939)-C(5))-methyltransferase RlmD n=1 Tax=Ferviditalea candida TaxID=3108399 RepID=A0ABU5ZNE4_9BACL|nr:23S rRNA (uracil(1939)-C(5))-methyltransferase RlmD [Paenibacillaceae bacterium T2]